MDIPIWAYARATLRWMQYRHALLIALLVLTGCNNDTVGPPTPDAGETPGTDAGPSGPPPGGATYYEHVRPILVENCVACHTPMGVAPFALETYEQAFEVGERMAEVTEARIMPPFLADNSGECQQFSNYRGLTDQEIATIGQWVTDGLQEGDSTITAPTPPTLPTLGGGDLTIEMPATYDIRTTVDDDYRCFAVDPGVTADTYVVGYEVHPGNPQRVHHVIVYNPSNDEAAQDAVDLDAAEGTPEDGYTCYGGPGVRAAPIVLWAPGAGAMLFPRGTGVQLPAGRRLVVQVHYNNLVGDDAPEDDRTTVDLRTRSSASPAFIVPFAHGGIVLPPRMEEVVQSTTLTLDAITVPVRVHGAFPHMHTLGRQLRVEIAGSADQCLVNVPRWDFNWQLAYWFTDPVRLEPGDVGTITCTYNTMSRDETVTWGDGSLDEMCLTYFYATL